jgi:hypothetical protein
MHEGTGERESLYELAQIVGLINQKVGQQDFIFRREDTHTANIRTRDSKHDQRTGFKRNPW